ncbi:glycoside hydrolase superfamily [Catenaria anguillulae PL171]|uniref:Glycoside hydrolase superfamily n=1 Tax=Catenaria anguillulae PL171 TaxID=765915 RepID=A0A1Y2HFI9_9FUNG|nr:glycoside hydrolase superfamily [Catenaria anguillulae PL171]
MLSSARALVVTLAVMLLALAASVQHANAAGAIFSYYYGQEGGLKPWEQPGNKITHVIFSFANILTDGTVTMQGPTFTPAGRDSIPKAMQRSMGNRDTRRCECQGTCLRGELYQTFLLKQQYPHLKTIMSIGGWTWSDNFSVAMSSQATRKRAIDTSAALMDEFGFDGLDIDWEFPSTAKDTKEFPFWKFSDNDYDNLALFFTEARAAYNGKYSLTAATPGFIFKGKPESWVAFGRSVDHMLVMAYEYQHGQPRTWGGGTLRATAGDSDVEKKNNVEYGLSTYLERGIPKEKLVVGIPLYGTGYSGLSSNAAFRGIPGFGAPTSGLKPLEPTAYNVLLDRFSKGKWTRTVDTQRGIVVYFDGSNVWFVDGPETVKMKAQWAKDQGFNGVMLWNSAQDMKADHPDSLISAISSVYPVDTKAGARDKPFCINNSKNWCNLDCNFKPLTSNVTDPAAGGANGNAPGPGGLADPAKAGSTTGSFGSGADKAAWTVSAAVSMVGAAVVGLVAAAVAM